MERIGGLNMFLTRIQLDEGKRKTVMALEQPQLIHGALQRDAQETVQRPLWRIDRYNGKHWLLVLCERKVGFDHLIEQFGFPDSSLTWETRDYDRVLEKAENNSRWRFRLKANPIRSQMNSEKNGERGRIYAHVTVDQQKKWLMHKALISGFLLSEDEFDVIQTTWYRFKKRGEMYVTLKATTFEGILEIIDQEKFKECLLNGIGKGKAYGLGMLTIMKG